MAKLVLSLNPPLAEQPPTAATEWLPGLICGDRRTQETVYRSLNGRFLKLCLRYARDEQEAAMWLNEAFFKIFTRIKDFKGTGSLEGWMQRIVVTTCLDGVRQLAGRETAELPDTEAAEANTLSVSSFNDALSSLSFRELVALVQELPGTTRTVFNLYVFDAFTHQEIARELGIKEGTSHWHLNQARTLLKGKLQKLANHHERPARRGI
jgi:RNA polymerase sigma-70 factor (ECF subfamily)